MERRDYESEAATIRKFYTDYDSNPALELKYVSQMKAIANREQVLFNVDLNHLMEFNADLAHSVMANTVRYVQMFSSVIYSLLPDHRDESRGPIVKDSLDVYIEHRLAMEKQTSTFVPDVDRLKRPPEQIMRRFEVVFTPSIMMKCLSPRDVRAEHIGKLVTVRGVVVRCAEVKPMLQVATYSCDRCTSENFQIINGPTFMPLVNCEATQCKEDKAGGRLQLQSRGSKFIKFQEVRIQEQSDQVPIGHVPRSMTIYLKGEVTRQCSPGDSVEVTGIFLPMLKSGFGQLVSGLLSETYLEAHVVTRINKMNVDEKSLNAELTTEEIEQLAEGRIYDKLAYSIAPEIFGHEDLKKSLLLLLVGGTEVNPRGMKIRGNINICLMGDPGVAKSQLLSYVDRLAVRSQYTTGRGSSGVGLTAAVMRDNVTGEWVLEGGALVLADQGVCCIDEFDKMMESDRTAIHEVMEQQTISIAKAGILTTLNARVSILAAANPVYGRYNPRATIEQNIQLPAALLSRFDLLILLRDIPDKDKDIKLAHHVTEVHRTGKQPEHEDYKKPLDMNLIRHYIELCKTKQPTIPEALTNDLVKTYVEIRKDARTNKDSTFTSPRTLLAVLRLSTALARLRLGDEVAKDDIIEAVRLMEMSKDTLRPSNEQKAKNQKPEDLVFATIRDLLDPASESHSVSYHAALEKVQMKGITADQFVEILELYQDQNILMVNKNRSKIAFV